MLLSYIRDSLRSLPAAPSFSYRTNKQEPQRPSQQSQQNNPQTYFHLAKKEARNHTLITIARSEEDAAVTKVLGTSWKSMPGKDIQKRCLEELWNGNRNGNPNDNPNKLHVGLGLRFRRECRIFCYWGNGNVTPRLHKAGLARLGPKTTGLNRT